MSDLAQRIGSGCMMLPLPSNGKHIDVFYVPRRGWRWIEIVSHPRRLSDISTLNPSNGFYDSRSWVHEEEVDNENGMSMRISRRSGGA